MWFQVKALPLDNIMDYKNSSGKAKHKMHFCVLEYLALILRSWAILYKIFVGGSVTSAMWAQVSFSSPAVSWHVTLGVVFLGPLRSRYEHTCVNTDERPHCGGMKSQYKCVNHQQMFHTILYSGISICGIGMCDQWAIYDELPWFETHIHSWVSTIIFNYYAD